MQGKKTGGRQLGTLNKLTRTCRVAIEYAADSLGGAERLAEWAAESPENEATFWRHIYPRLLPSSVNMVALQQRQPTNPEEVLQQLERRVGPEGRRLSEGFFAKVKRLEQQNRLSARAALLKNGAARS